MLRQIDNDNADRRGTPCSSGSADEGRLTWRASHFKQRLAAIQAPLVLVCWCTLLGGIYRAAQERANFHRNARALELLLDTTFPVPALPGSGSRRTYRCNHESHVQSAISLALAPALYPCPLETRGEEEANQKFPTHTHRKPTQHTKASSEGTK